MAAKDQVTAPELKQFIVDNVQLTGETLGAGAYGSVEEVEIPGARVAAKKLHSQLINLGSPQQVCKWVTDFVEECKLMSQLRHPHIVQFLGVCYLPGFPIPVLLMEKLQTSLDNLLETTPNIPLDVKVHLLTGTGQGLVYLHSHTPPIVHCNLTAKNILVDSGLTAKIADLGVARMVTIQPGQPAATNDNLYMPPETVQEEGVTQYNTAIDIFSFGVVSLFTLTQTFPKDLKPPNYHDPRTRRSVVRSEIERRNNYIQLMQAALGETHPLVKLTLDCLENFPEDRPSTVEVLQLLEEVGRTVLQNCTESKLELIQQRNKLKLESKGSMVTLQNRIEELTIFQQQQSDGQCRKIEQLSRQIRSLQQQIKGLTPLSSPDKASTGPLSITFNWRKCEDRPPDVGMCGQPVALNKKIYIRGWGGGAVLEYTPDSDQWVKLPPTPLELFTIAALGPKDQLLVVGGREKSIQKVTRNTILTFKEHSQRWVQSHPVMPTAVTTPAVCAYRDHLIVAGGQNSNSDWTFDVNILDTNKQWKAAQPLPITDYFYSELIKDTLYLVGGDTQNVLRAHVPTLISGAMSGVWETLANLPYYRSPSIAIGDTLLTVGGSNQPWPGVKPTTSIQMYDPTTNQWTKIGDLPKPITDCHCIVLSGKLIALGGFNTSSVYATTISAPH